MAALDVRTVFISDLHLGTPGCQADFLIDFLAAVRCRQLYLVGDIVDLDALRQRPWWPASHARVLARLVELAGGPTRVTYIPGNHDAALRGLAGSTLAGIEVRLHALHRTADGRRLRVAHGDEFDPEGIGRTWLLRLGDRAYQALVWATRKLNALRRRAGRPWLPLSVMAKSRIGRALAYIARYESLVLDRARRDRLDGHVCGHIHMGAARCEDGLLYLNDGDWVEHCTALVEHHDGTLELLHWGDRRTSLARIPPRSRETPGDVPAWPAADGLGIR
ncbi:MAG: UDP-2,3-diacylglucosamine diphosphatase [Xanthomonadales bacterium]|nr:UDP-2,3-diacylglucosamine diphosphatase [Xanthomonadales bacterium]